MTRWFYSRNRRRHWINDGESYGPEFMFYLEIRDNAPQGTAHQWSHGYTLFKKGIKMASAKRVKVLKEVAEGIK